jgi:anti-sigma factor RsiW
MEGNMTDERKQPDGELTRLADGSLPADRQADLLAQIERSPELTAALAEQERAVTMLRALDAPAPAALRARVDELTGVSAPRRAPRWRRLVVLPGATAIAAAAAAVVILVTGGTSAPTVPAAAHFALASATLPSPAVDANQSGDLTLRGAGIPFPAWANEGWTTDGARTDTSGGRRITTVFYKSPRGKRIGYAITGGSPLSGAHGATATRYGVTFTMQPAGDAKLITWVRNGHTCIIAGRNVSYATLLRLASIDERAEGAAAQAAVAGTEYL